jgi:FG-GAP-like repeat
VVNPGDSANNRPGVVNMLLGKGDGSFRAPVQIHGSQFLISVAVADFNNDQKLDVVIGDQSTETLSVLLGNGDGTFQPAKTITLASSGSVSFIVVADFNADNKPDLVAAVSDATTANSGGRILLGNGDGSFQPAAAVADSNHGGYLLVGDFDGDHRLDLALRFAVSPPPGCREFCISADITNLHRGNGDGTFGSGNRVGLHRIFGHGGTIAAGDFNADSKLDLFGGALFLWSGDGSFVRVPFDSSARGAFVATADFNSDNLPDLAFTDTTSNAVVLVLNTSPTSGADLALDPRGGQFIDEFVGSDVGFRATVFNEGPQNATGVT